MDQSSADRVTRPLCRHCGAKVGRAGRGLCRGCWDLPAVRARYEPLKPNCDRTGAGSVARWPDCPACGGKIASSGGVGEQLTCSTCQRPVRAREGYFRRIRLYAERAELKLPLFGQYKRRSFNREEVA